MNLWENDLATPVTVMKFGGTSLEDQPAFSQISRGSTFQHPHWWPTAPLAQ